MHIGPMLRLGPVSVSLDIGDVTVLHENGETGGDGSQHCSERIIRICYGRLVSSYIRKGLGLTRREDGQPD